MEGERFNVKAHNTLISDIFQRLSVRPALLTTANEGTGLPDGRFWHKAAFEAQAPNGRYWTKAERGGILARDGLSVFDP